jgi:glycosyltransferase involved in cell wall biosynthesis
MKEILLIVHDTSLSGAPKSILLLFEELRLQGFQISTLSINGGGALEERFINLSNFYQRLDILSRTRENTLINRFNRRFLGVDKVSDYDQLLLNVSKLNFDYIYANTVVSLNLGVYFKRLIKVPLILHVHELKTVIDEFQPDINKYDSEIDVYIVPSHLNKSCLIDFYLIPSEKIHVIREVSDFVLLNNKISISDTKNVLMCGGAYWRKGDDLFIQTAKKVLEKDPLFKFYWIGNQSSERKRINQADLEKLGITDSVFFIDETDEPQNWFYKCDIFMLTSREDPFPLAAIEAGMLGMPIFCFDKATGISEVIDPFCVVPYLDINAMANILLSFQHDLELINEIKLSNRIYFQTLTAHNCVKEIESILENLK